ncbi:MAG TPA: type IV pilus twitching motility protein PilT [Pyrinomonadaceae bacterium]|nr:type IV pilus twitching motility protein PilT [Pyrinomonadaceae bacterium]HMP65240.1 type IV pilus twitching motility protein PilT [Pyrinomonadaceae bacterium]
MDKLNEYLSNLVSSASEELRLEPDKIPYLVSANGNADIAADPLQGTQISMMVFPLIPPDVRSELPHSSEIEFVHPHNLGRFNFHIRKSPAGFVVTVRPGLVNQEHVRLERQKEPDVATPEPRNTIPVASVPQTVKIDSTLENSRDTGTNGAADQNATVYLAQGPSDAPSAEDAVNLQFESSKPEIVEPAPEYFPEKTVDKGNAVVSVEAEPLVERRQGDRRTVNTIAQDRMEALFRAMSDTGASDLHLSVSMPPMVRKDGRIQKLECTEEVLTPESMRELLTSIMPEKNRLEFDGRHDTDFAYEIEGLARFRCNVFMDRKGMGGVFRVIPAKMTTAEQLGLSKAVLGLCDLSKGLVVVTGPTGSGKSTTLCAMVNHINMNREDHIITIEDPIEFVHDNIKCLVNQREVHNHTDSFKDALRAALREDPDILLVGEMRDLETISIAIETAETGHLVFGTLHTTTAASTVDRIIDQFPADRQQQIRVMLSESLKGVIAQTLLPKKGGGRVAALEILIVTPAISNLIREGKTFQIPSAMQTGKNHGMVMLNDALFELVKKDVVEPKDAYLKSVDKAGFETMLNRGGYKI